MPTDDPGLTIPDEPSAELRYRRRTSVLRAPFEVWRARLLIRSLAERELRAVYKQAALGVAWAVVSPLALMLVLTIVFQHVVDVPTNGVPYALFSYVALVPWNFFSGSLTTGGLALVNQMHLVNKINCPREVFPLAGMLVTAVNSAVAGLVLILLFALNGYAPRLTTPLAIVPLALQVMFTLALTLIISSIVVYLRDLRHALPILLQLGLFATPIAYGMDKIAPEAQPWYCLANPMAPIVDAYRQTVLYGNAPNWAQLGLGAITTVVLFVAALKLFRRLEMGFADVA